MSKQQSAFLKPEYLVNLSSPLRNDRRVSIIGTAIIAISLLIATACSGAPEEQPASPTTTAVAPPTATHTLTPTPTQTAEPTATPTLVPTSTPVVLALESSFEFRPLAVMIDNHPDAQPQSGMSDADIIYEATVEFGITRFMAIYANKHPEVIGPVRSARHYFVDWASEYDSIFVIAGASPQGHDQLEKTGITNIDLTYGEGVFWRVTERPAPHNLYTSDPGIREWHGPNEPGQLSEFEFKPDMPADSAQVVARIVVTYPDGYQVEYHYDAASNEYARIMSGAAHEDRVSGEQYRPKNVIVQFMATRPIPGDDAGRIDMDLIGAGDAIVFQDGIRIDGSWRKTGATRSTAFLDEAGERVKLNAGQTWIQVLPVEGSVESS